MAASAMGRRRNWDGMGWDGTGMGCGLGLDVSVLRRSRDLSKVSSRSRLGHVGKRLGLVSVSGAKVSVLASVSTV